MLKTAVNFPVSVFRQVMDPRVSPLRHLPPVQRFQVMCVLGMMWTAIFCLGTGVWFLYGELMVLHLLMAAGAAATGLTFHNAAATKIATVRVKILPR